MVTMAHGVVVVIVVVLVIFTVVVVGGVVVIGRADDKVFVTVCTPRDLSLLVTWSFVFIIYNLTVVLVIFLYFSSRAVSNGGSTGTVVVACSALKLHYRDVLRGGCHRYSTGGEASPASANLTLLDHREGGMRHQDSLNTTAGVLFVHLDGSFELIQSRMSKREDHFMPTSLLVSQFDTLEPPATPEEFLRVDISADVLDIVKIITASVSF